MRSHAPAYPFCPHSRSSPRVSTAAAMGLVLWPMARRMRRLLPQSRQTVSVYHMTKTLDQLMFAFYAKNDGLPITDLHQGIVWGTQTAQTAMDDRLINRFDYDGDYGTVLNRFLMQAAIGHPLTVHGTGGQTRAFIHIRDTVRCIELAISNPPEAGSRPLVLNQITETFRVLELAKLVA
jgi:UDP-sulfoquinovose synthase